MKAVVLLSGGQDSTTCLFWAIKKYGQKNLHALGFDYNQRHKAELAYAKACCDSHEIPFKILVLHPLGQLDNNSLTNLSTDVDKTVLPGATPNSLVEGRNLIFLTYASIFAKTIGAKAVVTGVCETDFSGYPDCRDIFIKSSNVTISLALDYPINIETPLMWLNKAEIWKMAEILGIYDLILNQTLTCYNGIPGQGCGTCPACDLRKKGFEEYLCMN